MHAFVYKGTTRVWQLAAVNLSALALTLLGLGLFGLAPALAAGVWATARLDSLTTGQLVAGMWAEYRTEFVRANLVVLPLALTTVGCLSLALILPLPALMLLLPVAVMTAALMLAAVVVISRLSGSAADAWSNARMGFALAPWRHLALVLLAPLIAWTVWVQAPLVLYFGISVPCLLVNLALSPALACAMPKHMEVA